MQRFLKILRYKSTQAIFGSLLLLIFFTYLLQINLIHEGVYIRLSAVWIFVGCIIYFREKANRFTANIKSGELALELKQFEEDIVNALVIKQKLLEISSGRFDGPPQKLREILDILGKQGEENIKKYSNVSSYADRVIQAYKNIDTIGPLMTQAPDFEEKKFKMEQSQKELESALNAFLNHIKKD